MRASDAKRLKEIRFESVRRRMVVADLTLDNAMLKDLAQGKW